VWPDPDNNLRYAQPSYNGQKYISTGLFPVATLDANANERGREIANCALVTSLFFDADLVQLWAAERLPPTPAGQKAPNAKERKALMYADDPAVLAQLTQRLHDECVAALVDVLGELPTAVIDSGWGRHFHIALTPTMGVVKDALELVSNCIQALVQARVSWPAAWDKTQDVGARVSRLPGEMNLKCPEQPRTVTLLSESPEMVLTIEMVSRIEHLHNVLQAEAPPKKARRGAAPQDSASETVDFDLRECEGETWQAIVDRLEPGERERVICPFGGNSIGSGFFAKEEDGRTRYFSGPQNKTYWNSKNNAAPPAAPGRAQLVRSPGANGAPGAIMPTVSNLLILLTQDSRFNFWYDEFMQVEMNGEREVMDQDYIDITCVAQDDYGWMRPGGKDLVNDAINRVCRLTRRHPILDYIKAIQWDGTSRLETWLANTIGLDQTPMLSVYSKRWAISLIARLEDPGCKVDTMLILKGRQGFQKGTVFSTWGNINGKEYHSDEKVDMSSKEAYGILAKCWIYEDGELASSSRADEESRKRFLSSRIDIYRPAYARRAIKSPRHTVLVGTTNKGDFLKDDTGSRRYWVVDCARDLSLSERDPRQPKADLEWLTANRDQLLAEARVLYHQKEQWWLTEEEEDLRIEGNAPSTYVDYYTECAMKVYAANFGGKKNAITVKQFALAISRDREHPIDVQRQGLSLASALRAAGFIRPAGKINGVSVYYKYLGGEEEGAEPIPGNGLYAVDDDEPVAGSFNVNAKSFR
jgi:hypothetical protein